MLEVDHLVPKSKGGPSEINNCITSCADCNRGKADVPLEEKIPEAFTENELIRCQELLERRAAMNRISRLGDQLRREEQCAVNQCLEHWNGYTRGPEGSQIELPERHVASFHQFVKRLPTSEIVDAIDVAMMAPSVRTDHHVWKYFCGVCWGKIRDVKKTTEDPPPISKEFVDE